MNRPPLWPSVNALLNASTFVFLVSGYFFIRRKETARHRFCMLSAVVLSTLFLISYLGYHAYHGATRYRGEGILRICYFSILISHTLLAIIQIPLIILTLLWALRGQLEKHKPFAKLTLPIWLYVSSTGVIVYFILYV